MPGSDRNNGANIKEKNSRRLTISINMKTGDQGQKQ